MNSVALTLALLTVWLLLSGHFEPWLLGLGALSVALCLWLATRMRVVANEARALRLEQGALPIQLVLQERYLAAWSAIDLAVTHSRLGNVAALDILLASAIQREEAEGRPTADLWSRWGLARLGFGDESTARDYLGRALARGSTDAALVLGLMDLRAGRLESARNGLRPLILSDPPAAWALRGWGVSLLPPAHTEPAVGPPHRNP